MSFKPGHRKCGGRKQGTPNKKTLSLIEKLEESGLNIIQEITELLPDLELDKRVDVLLRLMPYIYPKRKPVENRDPLEGKQYSQVQIVLPSNGREGPKV